MQSTVPQMENSLARISRRFRGVEDELETLKV